MIAARSLSLFVARPGRRGVTGKARIYRAWGVWICQLGSLTGLGRTPVEAWDDMNRVSEPGKWGGT